MSVVLEFRRTYPVGRLTLTPFRQLMDGPRPVAVGVKPLKLLSVLAEAGGELVTKDELMTAVWPNQIVEENALQAHIVSLRRALGPDARLLSTCHGLGYRLSTSSHAHEPLEPRATTSFALGAACMALAAAAWVAFERRTRH